MSNVGGEMHHGGMHNEWNDQTDPLNPAGIGWGDGLCHNCGEDGDPGKCRGGRCPNCGSEVEVT